MLDSERTIYIHTQKRGKTKMAVTINKLNTTNMTVTLGNPALTRVWTDETTYSDILFEGTLTAHTAFPVACKVEIGTAVTSIGNEAFLGCTSLTSITIPSSVETFGENIFGGCSNLHTVNCPGRTCVEVEALAQGGGLDRAPTGEGDYMNYICSDGTNSIVAKSNGTSGYIWTVVA